MQTTTIELATSPAETMRDFIGEVRAGFAAGRLAPYLGPGVCRAYANGQVPSSYEELAAFFGKRVALPRRARGNVWASAQYIESSRHRSSVTKLLVEAYRTPVAPGALHAYFASLPLPLIVDSWYDGAMRAALSSRRDVIEVQGTSRVAIGESRWYRAYTPDGEECPIGAARDATTVLYKPHGGIAPRSEFLISDADYVEVLTEIDIQTPIPEVVRERREKLGFVFLGCRFHDQLLRTYARQIVKRSAGPHYAVLDPAHPSTRNEQKFLAELEVRTVVASPTTALAQLSGSSDR